MNVNAAPAPNTITGVLQVCANQTGVTYNITAPNVTSTYTWTTTAGGTIASAANNVINVDFSAITPVTITVTETSITGCVGADANVMVAVSPRPTMLSSNVTSVCSGNVPSLVFNSSIPGSTFNWIVPPGGITGAITGTSVGSSGVGNLSQALVNASGGVGFVTYNVTPTSPFAPFCQGTTQPVTVTVNPEPILVTPQVKTICSGDQVNYQILLSPLNLPTGTVFNWPAPVMSDASVQGIVGINVSANDPLHLTDILNNNTGSPITATYTITPSTGSCPGAPRTVVITINPAPKVSTLLDATKCSIENIGLILTTAGGSVGASNYNIVSRSISAGLTASVGNAIVPASGVPTNYLANDNFKNLSTGILFVTYNVVAVSGTGCLSAVRPIVISINPEPALSNLLDATVCSSANIGLTLATTVLSAPAPSYNVVGLTIAPGLVPGGSNAVAPSNGVALNYLSADKYTNTGLIPLTAIYQIVPVSGSGCVGDPPKSITITILPEPVISTTLSNTICSKAATNLTLNTNGSSVAAASYNVTSILIDAGLIPGGANVGVANGVPASYLSGDTYTNTSNSPLTVRYTVEGTSAAGCKGVVARIITMTINPEPVMSSSLDNFTCSDVAIGLTLNTNGSSVVAGTYNITGRSIAGGLTANGANVAVPAVGVADNYLAGDIFTNTGALPLIVTYTVAPVSASGCIGVSKIITITINPEPVVSTTLDAPVCSQVAIGLVLNTNGLSVAATTYNVTARSIAGGLSPNGGNVTVPASGVLANYLANDIYSNTGALPLIVTYTVVPISGVTCVGNARTITMTINPEPVIANALDVIVCSDASIGLTLNTNGVSVGASNYNIMARTVPGGLVANGSNALVPASNVAANYLASDRFVNTTAAPLIVSYTVVAVSASGCLSPSKIITATINPEPVVANGLNSVICSDNAIALNLNTLGSSVAAASYNITSRTVAGGLTPGGSNVTVPASGVAANYLSADVFTNTGTIPLNVTYTVVPVSTLGCLGVSKTITITINPEPVVSTLLNAIICSDTAIGLTLATSGTSVAAANYNITSRTISPGLVPNGANAIVPAFGVATGYLSSDQFTNAGTSGLTVTYTVVPVSSYPCAGNPQVITITINPGPVLSSTLDAIVCSDISTALVLSTDVVSIAAINYNITARAIAPGLIAAGTNVVVPAAGVSAVYLSNDKFTNTTSGALTVTYTIVPVAAGGCLGNPKLVTITINPEPVLSPTLNLAQCSDLATGLVLNTNGTSVGASNYNITSRTIAGGLVPAGTNVTIPASGVNANYLANDRFTNTGASPLTVIYAVIPISTFSCVGDPVNVTVTINPEPVLSTTLDVVVCSGVVSGLSLNTNGSSVVAANYNITARAIAGGLVANGANVAVPATGVAAGYLSVDRFTNTGATGLVVSYTVVPVSAAGCLGKPIIITATINPEPVISTTLDAMVCSDILTNLTLATNGTSVAAANYDITVRTIAVGLVPAGANVVVPSNGVLANYLANDKFTNTGTTPLAVTYTVTPHSIGCVGQPKIITITINPEPVTSSGLDKAVCSDLPVALTLSTTGTSVAAGSYNITSRVAAVGLIAAGANVVVPASGIAANYLIGDVFTNTGSSPLTVTYTVVPVSGAGCLGDPKVIVITINPEPAVATTLDAPVCSGLASNLTLATNGTSVAALNYTITNLTIAGGLTPGGSNVVVPAVGVASNYLTNDKFTNTGTTPLLVTYTVVPVSAIGCIGDPKIITLTINPVPVLSSTLDKAVCSGLVGGVSLSTIGASVAASNYNITSIVVAGGLVALPANATVANGVSAAYLANDKFTNTGASLLTVQYTVVPVAATGCLGNPLVVVLTIRPEPVMDPTLASKTVCSRVIIGITLNTNGISVAAANYNITLVGSLPAGLTGVPTLGVGLAANAIVNDSYINTEPVSLNVVYQVVPVSTASCLGTPFNITVTIAPEPVLSTGLNNAVCSREISNINLTTNGTSIGAASYKLISVTFPGTITANGSNTIVGTTSGVSLIRNDSYTNTTNAGVIVAYSIVPISGAGCLGQPLIVNLTVNPEPILVPGTVAVCSGVNSGIVLGTAVGSATITQYTLKQVLFNPAQVTPSGTNAGLGTYVPSNFLANDQFTNTTSSPQTVTYTIAPVAAGCVGPDQTVILTVNPAPAILDGLDKTVCATDMNGITFGTKGTSATALNYNIISVTIDPSLTQTAGNVGARVGVGIAEISIDRFQNLSNGVLLVTYKVEPVSGPGCKGPQKDIVLRVEPAVTMIAPGNANICSDSPNSPSSTNILLNSNTVPSAGFITFDYTAVSTPLGAVTGFFLAQANLPRLSIIADKLVNNTNNVALVSYTITPKAVGAKGGVGCVAPTSTVVTISVEPKPRLSITPATQVVCEGTPTTMTLSSTTVPGTGTIQFTKISEVPTGGMTRTSPIKVTYLNNEQIGDVWDNPTLLAQTVTYTFRSQIVGGLGCLSDDIVVMLTVNPSPTIVASPQAAICSSDFVNITLTPDVANTVATFTVSAPSVITGASGGAGNLIFQTLFYNSATPTVANSNGPVVVNYTVTPKVNGCTGPFIIVPVTINPKPKILVIPATYKICHGASLNIPLASNVIGANYTWTVDNPSGLPGIIEQTTPGLTSVSQILNNTTGVQASLTYTIKAFGPGVNPNDCEGDQKTVIVTVAPQISASFQNLPSFICKGTSEFLTIEINGQAPFSFVYNDGASDIIVTNAGNFKVIQVTPIATTTYTIKSVKDGFNCPVTITGQSVTVTVSDTDATFSIVGSDRSCSPFKVKFQHNQFAGTEYTWQWQDGSEDSTYLAATTVANQIVKHTFANLSPNRDQEYKVTLRTLLPAPFTGCQKFTSKKVTINSIIITNIIPDKTVICSGETIRFANQSLGVTSHKWFWRNTGTTNQNEIRTTPQSSYILTNTGALNPQPIQVVYQANNTGNCSAPDVIIDLLVYKGVTASFNEGTIPPFNSSSSTVTFTNTSTPLDFTKFRYDWVFGIGGDATPATLTQSTSGSIPVVYTSPGTKEIILNVTNIAAETASLSCNGRFSKIITIILPPLQASFDVDPVESCFPSSIKLLNVIGTGFVHEWKILNKTTGASSISNVADPKQFRITEPGSFTISYKTSIPATGQVAFAPNKDVAIYDLPVASFDLRPDPVFVPDTEMSTFNYTKGATGYDWDFGDGGISHELEPKYTYRIEGKYNVTLIAKNDHGKGIICTDTLAKSVTARQGGQAKIPNAFTPNPNGPSPDGKGANGTFNDVFLPIVRGIAADADAYNLQIYDRWGNLIFESTSSTHGWDGYNKDGILMPAGVYVYQLTLRFSDTQRTTQIGDVTMIR